MKKSTNQDYTASEPPQASAPASGSGARSRAEDQTPTDSPHGSAVPETKGWVELERVLEVCDRIAAGAEEMAALPEHHEVRLSTEDQYRNKAAEMRQLREHLAALPAEPGPQSERIGDAAEGALAYAYEFLRQEAAKLERIADTSEKCMPSPRLEEQWRERADKLRLVMDLLATYHPEQVGVERAGLRNAKADTSP